MRLIPITIEVKSNHDCFDILIAAICNWKNVDYRMVFCESWGFVYESIKDNSFIISNNLSTGRGDEFSYLKNYHGIDIKKVDINNEDISPAISKEIMNNSPVMLKVDVFNCPWMFNHYKIQHASHFIIINGYDEKTKKYNAIDNQMAINGAEFPENDLIDACKEVYIIRAGYETIDINTKDILRNAVDRLTDNEGNYLLGKRLEIFCVDLINYMNLDEEVKNDKSEPSTALLFQLIKQIGSGRYKFSLALEYIQNVKKDLQMDYVIEMLKDVSIKWNEVLGMLIKAYFLKSREKMYSRIHLKLMDIISFEEDIVRNIIRLINEEVNYDNYDLEPRVCEALNPVDYKYVDIKEYLNNNGVYKEESIYCNAELSNPSRYFVPKFNIENSEINKGMFKFKINNFMNDEFDNLICEGQEIKLDIDGYDKLLILTCSEFGNFDEKIEIFYDNNEKEIISFKTSTWLSTITREENELIFLGKGVSRRDENVNVYPFDVSLHANYYNLKNQENKIIKIKLPDCINIHIFAITFAK